MKFIRVTAKDDHHVVELVEDTYGRERVRRATTVKTITAARSVAQGWSNFNGKCKIIEGRKPARG